MSVISSAGNMKMVFREGRTKAVGSVTQVFPHVPATEHAPRPSRQIPKKQFYDASHAKGRQSLEVWGVAIPLCSFHAGTSICVRLS